VIDVEGEGLLAKVKAYRAILALNADRRVQANERQRVELEF
jgi:hypothetical protein